MKVALVGCGGISHIHIQGILDDGRAQLVCVADIKPERAQKAAQRTGAAAFTDLDEMLDKTQPDVLHICTPHYLHVPMALNAMERGIHVLIEKPCAVTVEELEELRAAQLKTALKVGTCFQNRYNRSAAKLKKILEDKELCGALLGVRGFVTWNRGEGYYSDDWHGRMKMECGGVAINQSIHTLDMMQYLAGPVKSVKGHVFNDHLEGKIEVEDTATALLEFENGASGIFYATTANSVDSPVFAEFICENTVFRMEGDSLYEVTSDGFEIVKTPPEEEELPGKACWGTGHASLIKDFYSAILEDRPFELDAFEGGNAVEIVLGIYRSSETGKVELTHNVKK